MDNLNLEARRCLGFIGVSCALLRSFSCDGFNPARCLGFIGVSCALLQTVDRPFETHHRKAVALSVSILIYFSLVWLLSELQTNGRNPVIVRKLCLLFGGLSVILSAFITAPHFGGLALVMWIGFFVFDVWNSYSQIRDEFLNVVEEIKMAMNTLRNGNTNERQVNGMQVENQHHLPV